MIPKAYIDAWRATAPWQQDAQVEQDLVISRALVELFSSEFLGEHLAFRGGTALHKLFLNPRPRYSEDIDLVQLKSGAAKPMLEAIHDQLKFLGEKEDRRVSLSEHNCTIYYQYETEMSPPPKMKVKIEINTREHFHLLGFRKEAFSVESPWFRGSANITTFELEELLATKMRALYQRKKGRDLFDLYYACTHLDPDIEKIVHCFREYIVREGKTPPTAREFEMNLTEKMKDAEFSGDIEALLRPDVEYDQELAYQEFYKSFIRNF